MYFGGSNLLRRAVTVARGLRGEHQSAVECHDDRAGCLPGAQEEVQGARGRDAASPARALAELRARAPERAEIDDEAPVVEPLWMVDIVSYIDPSLGLPQVK